MVLQARRVAQAQEEAKAAEEAEQARIAEKEATEAAQRQQEEERVAAAAAAAAKADAAAKRKAAAESAALEAQAAAAAAAAAQARALAFLEASKKADNEAAEAEAKIQAGEWTSSGGDASKAIVEFNLQIPLGMTLSEDMIVEEVHTNRFRRLKRALVANREALCRCYYLIVMHAVALLSCRFHFGCNSIGLYIEPFLLIH